MRFLKDVSKEMNKVSWLTKEEVFSQFLSVHIIGAVIILYFSGIDLIVTVFKNMF